MKAYGWGIVDSDGEPVIGTSIRIHQNVGVLCELVDLWTERHKSAFRVVELFYKDEETKA